MGAKRDLVGSTIPYLRFDEAAQEQFSAWLDHLSGVRLKSEDLSPTFISHLSKYRKLVPSLALINHLADGGCGPVGGTALARAIAYAEYLETHAMRVYNAAGLDEIGVAKLLVKRVKDGDITGDFTARWIYKHHWSGLTDPKQVAAGLEMLVDYQWLASRELKTGGRPATIYSVIVAQSAPKASEMVA